MRFCGDILLILRRILLSILLFYWAIFISFTIAKYIEGGPRIVATYYWHITCEFRQVPCPMNWGAFWFTQGIYLAFTLLLCLFEWRSMKSRRPAEKSLRG